MKNVTIALIFILLIIAGGVWLQIILSKKNNKWFGLILPFISFILSLLRVLGVATFNEITGRDVLWLIITRLLVSNIPTLIFLVIYFAYREKDKHRKELNKMNVQDLD